MLVTIGKAIKPWGVRGEVKVRPLTDFPERFTTLSRVHLTSPAGREIACAVMSVRSSGDSFLLLLDGYDTPEKARQLSGWLVQVPSEETVPLPEGQYYGFEIVGMEVFSEAGDKLGVIVDIFETGSNDVYVMKQGRREVYLPATAEVIKTIDRKAGRMTVRLVDGLLE